MKIMKKNVLFPVACFLMAAPLLTSCHDDVDSSTAENTTIHTYSLVADGAKRTAAGTSYTCSERRC